jgi:senataxin
MRILQVPKPFGAFFAEDNLETMAVKPEKNPLAPEQNIEVPEGINEEAIAREFDAADQADAGYDDDADMYADDGGGDD